MELVLRGDVGGVGTRTPPRGSIQDVGRLV